MRKLVLALGGSASTDGGTGLLAALGYQFADSAGERVEASAQNLHQIHEIRGADAVDLTGVQLILASDVTNPLTGPTGAAAVFGAQKGADYFLDLLGFDEHMRNVDLVITGEGRLDSQTLAGKLPAAVARRASPTPVIAVVGRNDLAEDSPLFVEIHAVAELSDADTAHDAGLTSVLLRRIGADIGHQIAQ